MFDEKKLKAEVLARIFRKTDYAGQVTPAQIYVSLISTVRKVTGWTLKESKDAVNYLFPDRYEKIDQDAFRT